MTERVLPRILLLLGAGIALMAGLVGGLGLMDVFRFDLASIPSRAQQYHGPLMVFGFVGTAIALERAVALRTAWAFFSPLLLILGTTASVLFDVHLIGALLWTAGFGFLVAIYYFIYQRATTLPVLIQTAGAVAAVVAGLRWGSTQDFTQALILAVIFVVMTVVGERVELARLNFHQNHAEAQVMILGLILLSCGIVAVVEPEIGTRLAGVVLMALVGLMFQRDVARHLIKSTGLPKFSAICMCLAYVWLTIGATAWVLFGYQSEGYRYDVLIHAIFLGFVMSMIFAHAPIIFTSVLHRQQVFSLFLYLPVAIMHFGLMLRIIIGDLMENSAVWRAGGILNVTAVMLFMVSMVFLLIRRGNNSVAA